jgi:uncharacterized protein YndB with AHSA1/START domain
MRKVEAVIDIHADPGKVIHALIDPVDLANWWSVERCYVEPKKDGIYLLAWQVSENGFRYVSTGIITDYRPAECLRIEKMMYLNPDRSLLGPMSLEITAKKMTDHTRVFVCQDGYGESEDWSWYYDAVKNAWPIALEQLKKYLES